MSHLPPDALLPAFPTRDRGDGLPDRGMTLLDYFAVHIPCDVENLTFDSAAALAGSPYPGTAASPLVQSAWRAEAEAAYRYHQAAAMIRARQRILDRANRSVLYVNDTFDEEVAQHLCSAQA